MKESMSLKYEPSSEPLHISSSGYGPPDFIRLWSIPRVDNLIAGAKTAQLLYRNVQWFRGGLVCKAHRLVCHLTFGLRVIKKKKKKSDRGSVSHQTLLKAAAQNLPGSVEPTGFSRTCRIQSTVVRGSLACVRNTKVGFRVYGVMA